MEIETTIDGTKAVLKVSGKVTVKSAVQLKAAVTALPPEVADIDIDVAKVTYLSSAGLRTLVLAAKLSKSRGGVMRMVNPTEAIEDVLAMTGLGTLLMPS